jgi:hypothetical protein
MKSDRPANADVVPKAVTSNPMTQPTRELLTNKDKIQILLHEYGTLRMEIIHRTNNLYQLLAVGGALFVWLMGHAVDRRFWISLSVGLPLLCLGFSVIRRYINKTARRLREIEKTVNSLAGLELLVWETLWAGGVTGYFARSLSPLQGATDEERPTDRSGL